MLGEQWQLPEQINPGGAVGGGEEADDVRHDLLLVLLFAQQLAQLEQRSQHGRLHVAVLVHVEQLRQDLVLAVGGRELVQVRREVFEKLDLFLLFFDLYISMV